jgi:hypothetical protein
MNFKELHEGAEPKMPGAPKGISIMTPQQFVASAGDMPGEEGVAEGKWDPFTGGDYGQTPRPQRVGQDSQDNDIAAPDKEKDQAEWEAMLDYYGTNALVARALGDLYQQTHGTGYYDSVLTPVRYIATISSRVTPKSPERIETVSVGSKKEAHERAKGRINGRVVSIERVDDKEDEAGLITLPVMLGLGQQKKKWMLQFPDERYAQKWAFTHKNVATILWPEGHNLEKDVTEGMDSTSYTPKIGDEVSWRNSDHRSKMMPMPGTVLAVAPGKVKLKIYSKRMIQDSGKDTVVLDLNHYTVLPKQGVAEGQEHLDRIRSLSGLGEATKLPAQSRDLDSQEFQDYMKRIVGTPDLDKAGNVKVDKKGNEKYTTGKTAGDKYKMPYIHRSSVVSYLSPDGKSYDEDAVKQTLAIRPKALLKQNEKMKHSNGEFEQFFNVGFAALVGIALDEQTNNLIVVNTCPGAGSCKVDCFAMKGGKIQFKAAWQSDGRILTYLLNDPDGFFNQLSNEISVESKAAAKGDKKFPNGWQVTVRWHDAGDFFSPEYLDMALKMAAKHPDVRFYAYTKMAGAALAQKPDNFIINWSEGANTAQEKQVKAKDPNLDTTKNSRIVPEKLFYDLLAKDEKGNLKKTDDGAWQPASPEALAEMKQRIAKAYGISVSSILSYTEYMAKRNSIPAGMKYNVIVAPGEGDVSANDPGVLSTLLLRH